MIDSVTSTGIVRPNSSVRIHQYKVSSASPPSEKYCSLKTKLHKAESSKAIKQPCDVEDSCVNRRKQFEIKTEFHDDRTKSTSRPPSPKKANGNRYSKDDNCKQILRSGSEYNSAKMREANMGVAMDGLGPRRRSVSDVHPSTGRLPVAEPGSPAFNALVKANEKVETKILQKRVRIGKTKFGRKKYNTRRRRFKRPTGMEINVKHEQYALTYGMMSGILNSVGQQNQFKQNLTMDDFMRVDKRVFPANSRVQLQQPFKFKDYSPDIFKQIRRRFNIDSADYMLTLCGDFNYIEFISNSKSGQFFFYSHDGRFMIKTQTKAESKFLRRILPHYYKFVMENPNTLIARFYGMHRVKMHHLRQQMHFVIMASVFDTPREIHTKFDLKGSTIGRAATQKERLSNGVFKDMDLVNINVRVEIGPEKRAQLLLQIRKDVEFLKSMKIMDYSMLIGINDSNACLPESVDSKEYFQDTNCGEYDPQLANSAGRLMRSQSLPEYPNEKNHANDGTEYSRLSEGDDELLNLEALDIAVGAGEEEFEDDEEPVSVKPLSPRALPVGNLMVPSESIFCKDEGGIYGKYKNGTKNGRVYFLGIIDILQQYNSRKIAETWIKGLRHSKKKISAAHPNFYGDRFIEFMEKNVLIDGDAPSEKETQL